MRMSPGQSACCILAAVLLSITAHSTANAGQEAAPVAPDIFDLQGAQWVAPGGDVVEALTQSPGECLRPPENKDVAYQIEVGRTAFRSSLLFGGPAAKSGLSCNSCHVDGHDNPDFFVVGLSDKPGTADVTSSLFSKVREDGVLNPIKIPTLVDVGEKTSFGTHSPKPSIQAFVESAVQDEFQGAPPAKTIVDAIAVYVSHLSAEACPEEPVRRTPSQEMDDVRRALVSARMALQRGDGPAADFMILSAQHLLGAINDRFEEPGLKRERDTLHSLARKVGEARVAAMTDPAVGDETLARIEGLLPGVTEELHKRRKKSLYNAKVLQRALEQSAVSAN